MKKKISSMEILLMLSTAAFIFLTTPAWIPGMAAAVVAAVIVCLVVWKLSPGPEKIREYISDPGMLCLGLVITSAFGCNFYNTWFDSQYVLKITDLLSMDLPAFLGICSAVGVLVCVPAVTCVLRGAIHEAARDFRAKKDRQYPEKGRTVSAKKALWLLFLIYVVGFSAVLRTNFYYMDDNGRAAFGYKTWDYFGRYLSTGFSTLLHMGDYLVDIAPLPQLVALLIMAVSGILLLYVVFDRTRFSLWELAAAVPLALNPYFLECLSFRFDAPYMALSVLAGILPLIYREKKTWIYLLASMLGILAVCTSYQAATGIFPILVITLALRMWNSGKTMKETVAFCMKSVAGYGLGLVYFKLVIMKPADAGYVSNSLPGASSLVSTVVGNYKTFYSLILTDFKPFWHALILLMAVGFMYLTVKNSQQKKSAALVLSVTVLILMLLLCFGVYPLLESTLFQPRAMYGFGVLLTILCIVTAEGWERIPLKMPAMVLSWVFFVFSFTYGNALDLQKEYTEFRIQMVMEDLNDLDVFQTEEMVRVRLTGGIGLSPILGHMPQDYKILERLVPESFAGGDDLSEYRFYNYYGLQNVVTSGSAEDCTSDMPVLKDGIFHTIRGEDNKILIELK